MNIAHEKKTIWKGILVVIACVLVLTTVHFYALRSYLIMFPYSFYHKSNSLIQQDNVNITFTNGIGRTSDPWYPSILVFHDDYGFGHWLNEPLALTVLYHFGGFGFGKKHSTYYDRDNARFSSFYGAYLVKNKENPEKYFGYDGDEVIISDIIRITEYDQRWLVMPSIGLSPEKVVFDAEVINLSESMEHENHQDYRWTKIDALIHTNSPEHHQTTSERGYLQYGLPLPPPAGLDDYQPITMAGRIYITKAENTNLTIAFYILAADFDIVDQIDAEKIAHAVITEQ